MEISADRTITELRFKIVIRLLPSSETKGQNSLVPGPVHSCDNNCVGLGLVAFQNGGQDARVICPVYLSVV